MVLKNNNINLVEKINDQAVTTSIMVAETFEKRHDHVLRDIQNIKRDLPNFGEMFAERQIKDSYGRDRRAYYMNKDGFTLLVMGYTGKKAMQFKLAYINQFNEMDKLIKGQRKPLSATEQLRLATQSVGELDERVTALEDNQVIQPTEYSSINALVSKTVYSYIRLRSLKLSKKQTSLLFQDIGHGIKQISGVRTRTQIRAKDAKKVYEYIDAWKPSTATMINVKDMGTEQQDLKV